MAKRAFITGITGQDGSYLAELLLAKGYEVHGLVRRASTINRGRIDHLARARRRLHLHYGDLTDGVSLVNLIHEIEPHEVYNLGAQSHVKVSFEMPEYTASTDAHRHPAAARGDPRGRHRLPLLPGLDLGDVRRDAAPAGREHGVLPALAVRRREALRALGDGQLPRGLRPVRRLRDPVQPRVPAPRRELRDPQDHPRRRRDQARRRATTCTSATSTPIRDWGYAPEYVEGMWRMLQHDEPRRLRARDRRSAARSREFVQARVRATPGSTGRSTSPTTSSTSGPPRSTR